MIIDSDLIEKLANFKNQNQLEKVIILVYTFKKKKMKGEYDLYHIINNMNNNTKLEIATEIMAAKIAKTSKEVDETKDEKIKILMEERTKMYQCDEETIDKIINVYGKEIK